MASTNVSHTYQKNVRELAPSRDCDSIMYIDDGIQTREPCADLCHPGGDTVDMCKRKCKEYLHCMSTMGQDNHDQPASSVDLKMVLPIGIIGLLLLGLVVILVIAYRHRTRPWYPCTRMGGHTPAGTNDDADESA